MAPPVHNSSENLTNMYILINGKREVRLLIHKVTVFLLHRSFTGTDSGRWRKQISEFNC